MKIQLVFDEQKRGDFDVNGPAGNLQSIASFKIFVQKFYFLTAL